MPRSHPEGNADQRRAQDAPEQQIQQRSDAFSPPSAAQQAKEIVHRPGGRPGQQAVSQSPELKRNFYLHGAAQQPGEEAALLSGRVVADGVDISLHLQLAPVQTELLDVQLLAPDDELSLTGGHDDLVLVKALHLLHAGDCQPVSVLQQDVVACLSGQGSLIVGHSKSPFVVCTGYEPGGRNRTGTGVEPVPVRMFGCGRPHPPPGFARRSPFPIGEGISPFFGKCLKKGNPSPPLWGEGTVSSHMAVHDG